jgi:hypothetical protein
MDVDLTVALRAANVRAFLGSRPPDALIIASGFVAQVGHLITKDGRWLRIENFPNQDIRVCYLEHHAPL